MNAADRVIRWATAVAVIGVAAVASVVPYEHAGALVRPHGESGWAGWHGAHDHISHQPVSDTVDHVTETVP